MDLNDIWEQNKRWILGVFAGLLLFWVSSAIVGTFYDGAAAEAGARGIRNGIVGSSLYDRKQLSAARAESQELDQFVARLQGELAFEPETRFTLAEATDPDLHFDQVQREVRSRLVAKAQQFGVDMSSESLAWPSPVGREEIEKTLGSLCVLNHMVTRLLDAGDEVRAMDFDALGLQTIEKVELGKGRRNTSRRPPIRRRVRGDRKKTEEIDVTARIEEFLVTFKFQADAKTVQLFLEKCRGLPPALLLQDGFKMTAGRNPGDPVTVSGQVVGLALRGEDA